MRKLTLAAVAALVALWAQETKPTCNNCSAIYVSADEVQAYLKRAPASTVADQQVRAVDVGKSHVDICVVYRGKESAGRQTTGQLCC